MIFVLMNWYAISTIYYLLNRFILSSIVLSIKFYDDFSISNIIGGISVEELSEIETLFYIKIDFSLLLKENMYKDYKEKLIFFKNKMSNRV